MPICSYLVHVKEQKLDSVVNQLEHKSECSVFPASNKDLLVLVTETNDDKREMGLTEEINTIEDIECMALTYANFEGEQ
jgi:nitrate reductase NapAB chaperone NapD